MQHTSDGRYVESRIGPSADDEYNNTSQLAKLRMMVTLSAWSSRPERQLWPQGHVYCDESTGTGGRWPGTGFCPGAPGAAEAKKIDPGRL